MWNMLMQALDQDLGLRPPILSEVVMAAVVPVPAVLEVVVKNTTFMIISPE